MLQWGRDPKAAESPNLRAVLLKATLLQWGRDPKAAERTTSDLARLREW